MGKRKRLGESEVLKLRRAARAGYASYRDGPARPVTLSRVFTGEKRRSMVSKVIGVLRDWRLSLFELEGTTRAGLRSGLCMEGYGWRRADNEAAELVAEALRSMGAKRPTWAQGQPEYTIARENCANCRGPLDEEAIANHDRFCCEECRTMMWTYRNEQYWYAASEKWKHAYHVARKESLPKRPCGWCGTVFQPANPTSETCTAACAAKLRYQKQGTAISDQPCANPTCGKIFRPVQSRVKYCCMECHREHQAATLGRWQCENPACGKMFERRFPTEKYCGGKCRTAAFYDSRPPRECLQCGAEFKPRKPSNMFCNRTCASRARAAKAKESAFACDEVAPQKKAA